MKGSDLITNGIRVQVIPDFIPKEQTQDKDKDKYLFSYTVSITNLTDKWVKLISRHWIIINAEGEIDEVIGEGVIGYQPEFKPNQSFTYTSYCPLDTPWGTMEGFFFFVNSDLSEFKAEVGRFYLSAPEITSQ